jgi:hypothetical protein
VLYTTPAPSFWYSLLLVVDSLGKLKKKYSEVIGIPTRAFPACSINHSFVHSFHIAIFRLDHDRSSTQD